MIKSPIVIPKATKGWVSHYSVLGTNSYDFNNLYSPDTAYRQSCVLDLASPKYEPNKLTIFDKSGYNNHGTIAGAIWIRLPSGLWVLYFDGTDDNITILDRDIFIFGNALVDNPFSVIVWANLQASGVALISKFGTTNATREWNLITSGSKLAVTILDSSAGVSCSRLGDATFTINVFSQLGMTYNGLGGGSAANGITLYRNGIVEPSTATNDALYVAMENTAQPLRLGRSSTLYGKQVIGEVYIYNQVLSPLEIQQNYQRERQLYGV